MMVVRCLWVVVVLLATSVVAGARVSAQQRAASAEPFRFREVLVLGDDESASAEYLFEDPAHVRTDADGRIYMAEHRGTRVRLFGPDGGYLGALGREGDGPGEFRDVLAIAVDAAGRLVVYDRALRRITRFPPIAGIDMRPVPDPEVLETVSAAAVYRFMHGLPDGRIVSVDQPRPGTYAPEAPRLHVLGEDLQRAEAFGPTRDWRFPEDAFGRQLQRSPLALGGSHVARGALSLLLVPRLYDGHLYRYVQEAGGRWALRRLEGRAPGHPTHEVVQYEDGDAFPSVVFSGGLGARYRSTSHGVGQLSDGRVVHLSTREDERGVRQLQLELFDADGTLAGAGPVEGFEHDERAFEHVERAVRVRLSWVDQSDRLYLVDRRTGFPVIRVVELED